MLRRIQESLKKHSKLIVVIVAGCTLSLLVGVGSDTVYAALFPSIKKKIPKELCGEYQQMGEIRTRGKEKEI